MAYAELHNELFPSSPMIILNLSEKEAAFLADVLGNVGGSPENSPRKYQKPISDALRRVGFDSKIYDPKHVTGTVIYKDFPEPPFVPGYFYTDNRVVNSDIRWFTSNPNVNGWYNAVRVNVEEI